MPPTIANSRRDGLIVTDVAMDIGWIEIDTGPLPYQEEVQGQSDFTEHERAVRSAESE